MTKEGFAHLAFEVYYNADNREGGWEAWPQMQDDIERGKWLAVGDLIDECVRKAGRDALRVDESEPVKTNTYVVTGDDGLEHRVEAVAVGSTADGSLVLGERLEGSQREIDPVAAVFAPGRWTRVRVDEATRTRHDPEAASIRQRGGLEPAADDGGTVAL